MTLDQSPGIGIDHEHRPIQRIQQDVVRGLRSNTLNGQQPVALLLQRQLTQAIKPPVGIEEGTQAEQALGLDVVVTGRPNCIGDVVR
jgi:hypothetical protein